MDAVLFWPQHMKQYPMIYLLLTAQHFLECILIEVCVSVFNQTPDHHLSATAYLANPVWKLSSAMLLLFCVYKGEIGFSF